MDPLGAVIPWIAACGALSLAGATFFERLIPILPSYVLLVTIGIAAADGHWSLQMAIALSVLGSVLGCLPFYALGFALGENRSRRFLERSVRVVGVSTARFRFWVDRFQAREQAITLGAQLIPTVRLIAPGISGLLRARFWRFLAATALGAALWNAIFIGVGYAAAFAASDTNASVLALKALVGLVLAEGLGFVAWRTVSQRRRAPASWTGRQRQSNERKDAMDDGVRFFRAWLADPLCVAALVPSSNALAQIITSEVTPASAPVIELGPGTGAFTRALIKRGVPETELALIEHTAEFSTLLALRFPTAQVLAIDAAQLNRIDIFRNARAGAIVSGLPVLSMPPKKVMAILEGAFGQLRTDGAFYQFTYGPRCPVPRAILDRLGLKAVRIGGTLANVPPAAVYRISRRPSRRRRSTPIRPWRGPC
jgi:phospholipid N-methyltransferase/membrane protein DedA with SNARE-associated domain